MFPFGRKAAPLGGERFRPATAARSEVGSVCDQSGFALVAILIATSMLLAIGIIGVRSAQTELKIASNELHAQQALAIAKAGLEHAVKLIEADGAGFDNELDGGSGSGGALGGIGGTATIDGDSYRFKAFGGHVSSDGYYVRVEDNFDETTGSNDPATDLDNIVKIVSRGRKGDAERVVEVIISPSPGGGFLAHFTSLTKATQSGGIAVMDSYDLSQGAYDPSNPGTNAGVRANTDKIDVSGGGRILGDATAGGVVETHGDPLAVTGAIEENATPLPHRR